MSQANSLEGLKTMYPLSAIKTPAPAKIRSLFFDKGINQGNVDNIEPTAAPPAIVATMAGNTQQSKVPEDVKRYLRKKCIELRVLKPKDAISKYNELKERKAFALIRL